MTTNIFGGSDNQVFHPPCCPEPCLLLARTKGLQEMQPCTDQDVHNLWSAKVTTHMGGKGTMKCCICRNVYTSKDIAVAFLSGTTALARWWNSRDSIDPLLRQQGHPFFLQFQDRKKLDLKLKPFIFVLHWQVLWHSICNRLWGVYPCTSHKVLCISRSLCSTSRCYQDFAASLSGIDLGCYISVLDVVTSSLIILENRKRLSAMRTLLKGTGRVGPVHVQSYASQWHGGNRKRTKHSP